MGKGMVNNLAKNGIDVVAFNRTKKDQKTFNEKLKFAENIESALANADIVFSMLSNPEAVENVFFGKNGGLKQMKQNAIWADCSTVNPSFSRKCNEIASECQIKFIDAPVAGSKMQAANAELVFLLGGEKESIDQITPFTDLMGKKNLHVGEIGKGAALKMLINMTLAQSMLLFSESILLGEKMGIDRDFLLDFMPSLAVSAPFTKFKAEAIRANDYDVNFPLELMHKDLHLATITAYEYDQPLFLANLTKEVYAQAKENGMGRLDFSAIHAYLEANK